MSVPALVRGSRGPARAGALSVMLQSLEETAARIAAAGRVVTALDDDRAAWVGADVAAGDASVAEAVTSFFHRGATDWTA